MALKFIAIDPDTDTDHCPAVFVEEETGDLLFQGWTVTSPATLAEVDGHSRDRGQRVRRQAPRTDAGNHPGGAQWARYRRFAS